jgi:hypothetical protein
MQITTIAHQKIPGYPREGGSGEAQVLDLDAALRTAWPDDRHFQALAPWVAEGAPRRVNVAQLTDEQLARQPVVMRLRVFDIDTPAHTPRTEEWVEGLRAALAALPHAKPQWYLTRSGARLIWPLPAAGFTIDSREKYREWVKTTETAIRQFREAYGIVADPACKDPSRLYRLPNVERPEHGAQRSAVFGELEVWDYKLFAKYAEPTVEEKLDSEASACDLPARDMKLARAFETRGGLRDIGASKVAVRCPWVETHSDHPTRDALAGGTVVFATADGAGYFHCSHSHCVKRRQAEAFAAVGLETPWELLLDRTRQGGVKNTSENVLIALEGTGGPEDWAWNARAERWECPRGKIPATGMAAEFMLGAMTRWVNTTLGFEPSTRVVRETILPWLMQKRSYNPLTEWLDGCAEAWDGRKRSLADYLDLQGDAKAWARIACGYWLRSAVARAYAPGCQADLVLVLQGPQGIRKSSLLKTLGRDWFLEMAHAGNDRETLAALHRGAWLVEFAEGVALTRSESSELKALITRRTDAFRRAYAAGEEERPRSLVFAVTTNQDTVLSDATGNRRFVVVQLEKQLDVDGAARDLEQLWGQVVAEYRKGLQWHLTDQEAAQAARKAEEVEQTEQPIDLAIQDWTDGLSATERSTYAGEGITTWAVYERFQRYCRTGRPLNEIGAALRKTQVWGKGPKGRKKVWVYTPEKQPSPLDQGRASARIH